ncbi:MAG: glycosyltransferase [Chitinivibrionales bacterium]|nr:glycosyltransferase [Chitinivibrionales bacterium]
MNKVLHIIRDPVLGGAEILVKNVINADEDIQYRHYLLYCRSGPLLKLIKPEKKNRCVKVGFRNRLVFIWNLRRLILSNSIFLVHTHQPIDAVFAILATIGSATKIVKTYHGYSGIYSDKASISAKVLLCNAIINRFVSMHFFVSHDLLAYNRRVNPKQDCKRQRVLWNGIDTEELLGRPKADMATELKIPSDSILMGMVGSFSRGRDQYTLCVALKKLIADNRKIHFLFVGGRVDKYNYLYCECRRYCLENHLDNNVHFLGVRDDIGGILKSIDVYVHSSNNDTFGFALVEAMIVGVPCIASNIPPFHEVSDEGKHVLLFNKGDDNDLRNKIDETLREIGTEQSAKKCIEAREFAIRNFSIAIHQKKLHESYRSIDTHR